MTTENELAGRVLARLKTDELPAMVINGQHWPLSALQTMPDETRLQWGQKTAAYIGKVLQAADKSPYVITLEWPQDEPEAACEFLPGPGQPVYTIQIIENWRGGYSP